MENRFGLIPINIYHFPTLNFRVEVKAGSRVPALWAFTLEGARNSIHMLSQQGRTGCQDGGKHVW